MPGTNQAGKPGELTNAADLEANANADETATDDGLYGDEGNAETNDAEDGIEDGAENAGDESNDDVQVSESETGGDKPKTKTVDYEEFRKLQLQYDRQANELGTSRKLLSAIAKRLEKGRVGMPTSDDWANNPDEAAKAEQELKQDQEDIEAEHRRITHRSLVQELNPDFDGLVPDMVKILEGDKAPKAFIEDFKRNPYDMEPTLAHNLADRARIRRELDAMRKAKPGKPAIPAAPAQQRRLTPTDDRSGSPPSVNTRGKVTIDSLQSIMSDPDALDKALEGLSPKELDALLQADKQRQRQRLRR